MDLNCANCRNFNPIYHYNDYQKEWNINLNNFDPVLNYYYNNTFRLPRRWEEVNMIDFENYSLDELRTIETKIEEEIKEKEKDQKKRDINHYLVNMKKIPTIIINDFGRYTFTTIKHIFEGNKEKLHRSYDGIPPRCARIYGKFVSDAEMNEEYPTITFIYIGNGGMNEKVTVPSDRLYFDGDTFSLGDVESLTYNVVDINQNEIKCILIEVKSDKHKPNVEML